MNLRGKDKTKLLSSSKSGVGSLVGKTITKTFLKGKLTAKRVVVPGNEVKSKTSVHSYNPRNKDALSIESVSDIFDSIKENGVSVEGIAVKSPDGVYLVLDSSRRRFCCIETSTDLPLWVLDGEPSNEELLALINDSQEVKRWSYREHAQYLVTVANLNGIDVEAMKVEELAKHLSIGRESLRKRLEALSVDMNILCVFPHYENIPNSYYQKLSKAQRVLLKANRNISDDMKSFKSSLSDMDLSSDLDELHKKILTELELFVAIRSGTKKKGWQVDKLADFDKKHVSATRKVSADGRKHVYELSRVEVEKLEKIDEFIRKTLREG